MSSQAMGSTNTLPRYKMPNQISNSRSFAYNVIAGGLSIGLAVLISSQLMDTIGNTEAIALVGFSALLSLPFSLAINALKNRVIQNATMHPDKLGMLEVIAGLILSFGTLTAAYFICNEIPSLSKFSYADALKLGGIHLGLTIATPIALFIAGKCVIGSAASSAAVVSPPRAHCTDSSKIEPNDDSESDDPKFVWDPRKKCFLDFKTRNRIDINSVEINADCLLVSDEDHPNMFYYPITQTWWDLPSTPATSKQ